MLNSSSSSNSSSSGGGRLKGLVKGLVKGLGLNASSKRTPKYSASTSNNSTSDASPSSPDTSPLYIIDELSWSNLQRCQVEESILFIPLELSSKDYIGRVFDLITAGISARVDDILKKGRRERLAEIECKREIRLAKIEASRLAKIGVEKIRVERELLVRDQVVSDDVEIIDDLKVDIAVDTIEIGVESNNHQNNLEYGAVIVKENKNGEEEEEKEDEEDDDEDDDDYTGDIRCLLMHILGIKKGRSEARISQIRDLFRRDLGLSNLKRLIDPCTVLLTESKKLSTQLLGDIGTDKELSFLNTNHTDQELLHIFDSGRALLQCFPIPADHFSKSAAPNPALKQLQKLQLQFQNHQDFKKFRMMRLAQLKTNSANSTTSPPTIPPTPTLKQLIDLAVTLQQRINLALERAASAHTMLIVRLKDAVSFLDTLGREAGKRGQVSEARRLEDLMDRFSDLIDLDDSRDDEFGGSISRLESIKRLVNESRKTVADLESCEKEVEDEEDSQHLKRIALEITFKIEKLQRLLTPKRFNFDEAGMVSSEGILRYIFKDNTKNTNNNDNNNGKKKQKHSILSLIYTSRAYEVYSHCCRNLIYPSPLLNSNEPSKDLISRYSLHLIDCLKYSHSLRELVDSSFPIVHLGISGYKAHAFKAIGLDAKLVKDSDGMTIDLMIEMQFSVSDLKGVGFYISDPECALLCNKSISRFVSAKDEFTLETMLASGAINDINIRDLSHEDKATALIYQTQFGSRETIEFLLSSPCSPFGGLGGLGGGTRAAVVDVNLKDKSSNTALFYAIRRQVPELVRLLINHGADRTIGNIERAVAENNDCSNSKSTSTEIKALILYYKPDVSPIAIEKRKQALRDAIRQRNNDNTSASNDYYYYYFDNSDDADDADNADGD